MSLIHSDPRHLPCRKPTITQLRSIDPQQPGILHLSLLPARTHTYTSTHIYTRILSISLPLSLSFLSPFSSSPHSLFLSLSCSHSSPSASIRVLPTHTALALEPPSSTNSVAPGVRVSRSRVPQPAFSVLHRKARAATRGMPVVMAIHVLSLR